MSERYISAREKRLQAFELSQLELARARNGEGRWAFRNSPLRSIFSPVSFDRYFHNVLPKGERRLKAYIEGSLAYKKGEAIAVEVGGVGSKLFSQFTPNFFLRTAGVNLSDSRFLLRGDVVDSDRRRNHTVIPGNIFDDSTQADVCGWLGKDKIDVLFSRMIAGNYTTPQDPYFFGEQANFWYKLLAEKGMIFAQIPPFLRPYMKEWGEFINSNYADSLDISIGSGGINMRLQKLPGAPENLPLLDAKSVLSRWKGQELVRERLSISELQ